MLSCGRPLFDKIYKMKNETFNNYINSFLFNEDLILKDGIRFDSISSTTSERQSNELFFANFR